MIIGTICKGNIAIVHLFLVSVDVRATWSCCNTTRDQLFDALAERGNIDNIYALHEIKVPDLSFHKTSRFYLDSFFKAFKSWLKKMQDKKNT